MKKFFILLICFFNLSSTLANSKNNLYEKIDLFGEVLENIKKVADSIGYIYYYDAQRDEYMHPAAITLLSSEGKISRYLYGIEYPVKDLKLGILEASEGKIGSTLGKIILYCYHYDPYKNTYTIFATNIMRLGGIFTILFLCIMLVSYWKKDKNLFDKDSLNVR